ncbi:pyridoxamine 5'-phosphate oxidase family protein [bacterium]|nr:pyridoxamine 5'-phosphate oxidase family protein [bacterium]NDC94993.1 pyridoxamine 5'-phosphate oxidase family protein [bacterium]NDD85536.1 pyridoxamine 5'-phosphate oxidase family protein [bacterium]NDG32312.1 pyridoxamine 5'-phosphate oxidase family protein [bacterium]
MNDDVDKILRENRYATVSTVDSEGKPWAAPVWYVYDDDMNIYWWSPSLSQHSKNIKQNANVYITIFDSKVKEGDGIGLYVRAVAREVNDSELDVAINSYNNSTEIFKLSRDNCTANAPTRLYVAVPSESWLNRGKDEGEFYIDFREEVR